MDPERWKEIESIYHAALAQKGEERAGFLERACGGDDELRREVETLLEQEDRAKSFLQSPALEAAARSLAEGRGAAMIGRQIGSYRIVSLLGAGGMGEVYLAEDQKLERRVALKFLPEELEQDETARKRFLREARSAAALDHPFICHIHEVGEVDGTSFIAMEHVEGETLDRRLTKGPLALNEALEKGIELAEALEAAHRHNIVHRDLKPSNIMLTPEGHVKVMDFGLAKRIIESEGSEAPTQNITASLTKTGMTLGTVAYMSPEQLRGGEVDTRSDIFSLGIVLYAMLTGVHPFKKPEAIETGHAILSEVPPPLSQHLHDVSPLLQHTIHKMLAKQPDRRYQVIHDVRTNLQELREEDLESRQPGSIASPETRRLRQWRLPTALGLIAIGIAAAFTLWLTRSPAPSQPVLKRLTFDTGLTFQPALSPDGQLVAYASDRAGEGNLDIWVQQVGGGEPIRLTRHAADDHEPTFSPDGTKIAFRSEREETGVYVIPTLGGDPRLLAPRGRRPRYSPDGEWIAYWTGWPHLAIAIEIHVVASSGGQSRYLHEGRSPVWSPDSKHLLFHSRRAHPDWWVIPLEGGEPVSTGAFEAFRRHGLTGDPGVLGEPFIADVWLPENNSIAFSAMLNDSTNLWQARIPLETWKVTGPPQRLTLGTATERQASNRAAGRMVFTNLVENKDIWALPVHADRGGPRGEPQRVTSNAADDSYPSLSLDGKRMVFLSRRSGNWDVWMKNLETGRLMALTETLEQDDTPIITADGSTVAFKQNGPRQPTYIVPARGLAKKVCDDCGPTWDWSNDGKSILASLWNGQRSRYDHSLLDVPSGEVRELPLNGSDPRFSPDDRWIAFQAIPRGLGMRQIFISPFRGGVAPGEGQWIAVTDGSTNDFKADWSPDGNLLYFASDRDGFRCLYVQPLHPRTKRPVGAPLEVHHFHVAGRFLVHNPGEVGLSVARDKIAFTMQELSGNIWMMSTAEEDR